MSIVVSVPFHYTIEALEKGFRVSRTFLVRDWMPVRIRECGIRELPLVMKAKALWEWDWKSGHSAATTEIRRDGESLLAVPEILRRRGRRPCLEDLCLGYAETRAWNLRDHPFQHRFWKTHEVSELRLRKIVRSGGEEAAAGVSEMASRLVLADGLLYVPVPEMAYAVRAQRSRAGSFVWVTPVAHVGICPLSQVFAANRLDEAMAYAEWLAAERRLCPARTEIRVLGEIDLRDPGRVSLDGMRAGRRNIGIAIMSMVTNGMPDEAARAYGPFWKAYHGDAPLDVDAAVAALSRGLSGVPCDVTSNGRLARLMAEYVGRLALFGPGAGAVPEEDEESLSALA